MANVSIRILAINILKVNLKVRFPCSVCCGIKIDGKQNEIEGEQQLKNGQAKVNFTYFHEIEVENDIIVTEPKVSVLIFLITQSGRIPAGSLDVKVSKANMTPIKQTAIINKCPDKNALLQYQFGFESSNNSYKTIPRKQSYKSRNYSQKNKRLSLQKNIIQTNQLVNKKTKFSSLKYSKKLSISTIKQSHELQQDIDLKIQDESRDLSELQFSKISIIQKQLQTTKQKIFILESDLDHKENLLKETMEQTKHLQKQNQKMEIQLKTSNYKIECLDKHCKQLTSQIKDMTQKHQEEKMIYENGVKRIQIRQNSYKEQIKTLTDKFYNCQNQKQRMVHDKNLSSNQYQSRQKKLRQSHQQKQKKHFQEKVVLEKKLDSMQKEIQRAIEQIQSSKSKYNQILQKNHQFEILYQNLLAQKQKIKIEHNNLKYQLTKIKNQKQILESNLQSNSKFNEERRFLKRQLSMKEIQNLDLKDKLQYVQLNLDKNKSTHQEYDKILKQKEEQFKLIQHNFQSLTKEIQETNQQLNNKEKKIVTLIQELQIQINRNNTYQIKIDELEQQIDQYKIHQQCLDEIKQKLQQQLHVKDKIIQLNTKNILYLQKQCMQYQRCLNQKGKHIQQCELQISKLNEVYREVQFQKLWQQNMNQQILLAQKMKENEYQKTISDLKKSLDELSSQSQRVIKEHHQEINILLNRQNEAKNHLNEKLKMMQTLQNENKNLLNEKERLKRQIEKKQSDMEDKLQQISQLTAKLEEMYKQRQAALQSHFLQQMQKQLQNNQTKALQQHLNEKSKLEIALRTQMERVNQLQVVNTNLMNQLKQERQNCKKVMRQLQHECHLFEQLKIEYEQEENKNIMKDLEIRKEKMKGQELKNIIQLIFAFIRNQKKDESYIQELRLMIRKSASSQTQSIRQQLIQCQKKIEYFLLLENEEFQNKEDQHIKIDEFQSDMSLLKQQLQYKRNQIKVFVNEFINHDKEMKGKQRMKIQLQQQLHNIEQEGEELLNAINNLQKDKKASFFNLIPIKLTIKKINGLALSASKNISLLMNQKFIQNSKIFANIQQNTLFRHYSLNGTHNIKII